MRPASLVALILLGVAELPRSAAAEVPAQCLATVDLTGAGRTRAWCSQLLSLSARQPPTGVQVNGTTDRRWIVVTIAALPIRLQLMVFLVTDPDLQAAQDRNDRHRSKRAQPPRPTRDEGDCLLPCSKSNPPCLPDGL